PLPLPETRVMPAAHSAFGPAQGPVAKVPQAMPYAVPPPVGRPKHLFHFIIRYEGEGIIDSNVAELYKSMNKAGESPPSLATVIGVPASACLPTPVPSGTCGNNAPQYMLPCGPTAPATPLPAGPRE